MSEFRDRVVATDSKPVQVWLRPDELAAIDAYRRTQANPPSRPQAIRDVLRNALSEMK